MPLTCAGTLTEKLTNIGYRAVCDVPFTIEPQTFLGLPPLSVSEASSIATSTFVLWATAFVYRQLQHL
jgi:hypothetical protein